MMGGKKQQHFLLVITFFILHKNLLRVTQTICHSYKITKKAPRIQLHSLTYDSGFLSHQDGEPHKKCRLVHVAPDQSAHE